MHERSYMSIRTWISYPQESTALYIDDDIRRQVHYVQIIVYALEL